MRVCSCCQRCYDDSVEYCADESHPPLSEPIKGDPEMIAGYRLDFLLESGINGEFYRARQSVTGRSCLIRTFTADKEGRQKFFDEAKLAAVLFHPAVIDVYEAGSLGGDAYFVVAEEPEGKPLREVLNTTGVLPLLTSIRVVRQTAEALHAIHQKGLLHRAVRPENIVLTAIDTDEPEARIQGIDLGGVIQHSIVSNKFLIDTALDSLRYFAPEQCLSEPACPQADVYGLGIVFYEMLAGKPPFDAAKATALIEKHRNERPPDVRIDDFELRMLVTHALTESLNKRPERRQSSANAFARQMRHIEQLATHVSTPPPVVTVRPARPKPVAAAAAVPAMAVDKPVPVVETTKLAQIESDAVPDPVSFSYELINETLSEPVLSYQVESEVVHEPSPSPKTESEAVRSAQSKTVLVNQSTVEYLPKTVERTSAKPITETLVLAVAKFVSEKIVPAVTHLSRLNLRRKKQSEIAQVPPPIIERDAQPATGPGPDRSAPIEIVTLHTTPPVPAEPAKPAGSLRPVKIEWNQPEEDIPSMEDVLEVLAKEQITTAPVSQPADVPISRPDPEPAIKFTEAPAPVPVDCEKSREEPILFAEPETPVKPKEEPVYLAEPKEVVVKAEEQPVLVTELIEPVTPKEEPIYAAEPNELSASSEERPVFLAEPEEEPVRNTEREEEPVLVEEPIEQAVIPRAKPILRAEPIVPPVRPKQQSVYYAVSAPPAKLKGVIVNSAKPKAAPVKREEPEEITLVRARRLTIPVQTVRPRIQQKRAPRKWILPRTTGEVVFVPTILGNAKKTKTVDADPRSLLFSNYYPAPQPGVKLPRRSLVIGGGLMVLIALFLFGNDFVKKLSLAGTSGDSVAKTAPSKKTAPALANPASPAGKKPVKNFTNPKPDDTTAKPPSAKDRAALTEAKSQPSTDQKKGETLSASLKPTTSLGNAKPKPEPRSKAAEKPSPSPQNKTAGATRPRIVKNPKP